jgi:ribonuclease P protein component
MGEAHLSTEQPETVQEARLSSADVNPRRSGRPEGAPRQGPRQAVGLIWSVRDRAVFDRLATDGRRFRTTSPIGVRFAAESRPELPPIPPRVAFAINRSVGDAVARNRLRRRIRMILRAESAKGLPSGTYLVTARPGAGELSFAAVSDAVVDLCDQIRRAERRRG